MKKIIALSLITIVFLLSSCHNGNVDSTDTSSNNDKVDDINITEMTCEDIIGYIYEKAEKTAFLDFNLNLLENTKITDDRCSSYFGISINYESAVASEPSIQPPAYSLCVAKIKNGENMDNVVQSIKDNANPQKWVCTGVSTVYVESIDNTVILIMSDKDTADSLKSAFLQLAD